MCSFKDKRTDQEVAIKIIYITRDSNEERSEDMVHREVSMQCLILNHTNIVRYHECWEQDFSSIPSQIQRVVSKAVKGHNIKMVFCFKMNLYDCKDIFYIFIFLHFHSFLSSINISMIQVA